MEEIRKFYLSKIISMSFLFLILFSLGNSKKDSNYEKSEINNFLEIENTIFSEKELGDIKDVLKQLNNTLDKDPYYKGKAWEKTAYIVDTYGPRLWGGKSLEAAVVDIQSMMKMDKFENYYLEEVKDVDVWIRGKESLTLFDPRQIPTSIPMIGLGLSVGGDVKAEVIVVKDWDDLKQKDVSGKIVFYNCIWKGYGETVEYRVMGGIEAAKKGAVGVLIRSITPISWETPHTGMMIYDEKIKKIPACAISLEDADMFQRMADRGQKIVVRLYMEGNYDSQKSTAHNIIAELKGSEKPDEIILMGGHIDSWDVGPQTGATDDLAGFIVCYEALRILTNMNFRPKRTIRLIGWSGEEMGKENNGAHVYVNNRINEMKNHILAFESDLGANDIFGFGLSGSDRAGVIMDKIVRLFNPYGINKLTYDGENADVGPLFDYKVPILKNLVESTPDAKEYFTSHHTAADNMNRLNPEYMDRNVFGIAGMMYIVANLSEDIPKNDA